MEEIISRNILIIGPHRCGKSSITNYISGKYQKYEPLRCDPAEVAYNRLKTLKYLKSSLDIDSNSGAIKLNLSEIIVNDNDLIIYLKSLYEQTKIDLKPINRNIVMDTMTLSVKDAKENFGSDCDIYCLGMLDETAQNLVKTIREKDTEYDWTYYASIDRLEVMCQYIIDRSKKLKQECKEYNVKFFDTSGNREEKLKQAIMEIENSSIYC